MNYVFKLKLANGLRSVFPAAAKFLHKGMAVDKFNELVNRAEPSQFARLEGSQISYHLRNAGYDRDSDTPYQQVLKLADKAAFEKIVQEKLAL